MGFFCFSLLSLLHVCLFFGYALRPGVAFCFAPPLWLVVRFLQKPKESSLWATPEGQTTRYRVTKEQSPGIKKFELRRMKPVELDEQEGNRSDFSSHDSVSE